MTDDYKNFLRNTNMAERDSEITSSVNALSSLGLTAGVGALIAGKSDLAAPIIGGIGAGAGAYHLARIAGASPAVRLLLAALSGGGGAAAGTYMTDNKHKPA